MLLEMVTPPGMRAATCTAEQEVSNAQLPQARESWPISASWWSGKKYFRNATPTSTSLLESRFASSISFTNARKSLTAHGVPGVS